MRLMSSEAKPSDACIVAEWIGRTVIEAERCGAPASVVLELQRLHDLSIDRVTRERHGWR